MNITNTKNEIEILEKFLKERGLLDSYNTYKKIPETKKKILDIQIDGVNKKLLIYSKNKKLIISDFTTLEQLATTSKYNLKNVQKGFLKKNSKRNKGELREPDIKLNTLYIEKTKNITIEHRQTPKKLKFGKVFISVSFYKGHVVTIKEGGSRKTKILSRLRERNKAIDEAFKGALSQVTFSYDTYKINWIHYVYYKSRIEEYSS